MTPWRCPNIAAYFVLSVAIMVAGVVVFAVWPTGGDPVLQYRVSNLLFLGGMELTVYTGAGVAVRWLR